MEKMQVPKTAAECIEHLRGRLTPDEWSDTSVLIEAFSQARALGAVAECHAAVIAALRSSHGG
jgi:hypothetical protein